MKANFGDATLSPRPISQKDNKMLEGKKVCLRGIKLEDVPLMWQQYNDLELRRFLDHPHPQSKEDMEQWVRNVWDASRNDRGYYFGIELKQSQQLIGACGLFALSRITRNAELMIVIYNKEFWGQGYGTEALSLLIDYGFKNLNLHRIFLFTHEENIRAQRAYEKIGFRLGGRRRQASFFDGTYHDLLLFDLLASEFHKQD